MSYTQKVTLWQTVERRLDFEVVSDVLITPKEAKEAAILAHGGQNHGRGVFVNDPIHRAAYDNVIDEDWVD